MNYSYLKKLANVGQEFNLTSIAEAQKSTTMNRSMKRLSWITVNCTQGKLTLIGG